MIMGGGAKALRLVLAVECADDLRQMALPLLPTKAWQADMEMLPPSRTASARDLYDDDGMMMS